MGLGMGNSVYEPRRRVGLELEVAILAADNPGNEELTGPIEFVAIVVVIFLKLGLVSREGGLCWFWL